MKYEAKYDVAKMAEALSQDPVALRSFIEEVAISILEYEASTKVRKRKWTEIAEGLVSETNDIDFILYFYRLVPSSRICINRLKDIAPSVSLDSAIMIYNKVKDTKVRKLTGNRVKGLLETSSRDKKIIAKSYIHAGPLKKQIQSMIEDDYISELRETDSLLAAENIL